MELVMSLLSPHLLQGADSNVLVRLAMSLAACAQLSHLCKYAGNPSRPSCFHGTDCSFWMWFAAASERMWALQNMRRLLRLDMDQLNIGTNRGDSPISVLSSLLQVQGLPQALLRQHDYEEPAVRAGKQLVHSSFFQVNFSCHC